MPLGAVAEAGIEQHPPTLWNDRLFGAVPVAPLWVGAAIAIGLLALFALLEWVTGGIGELVASDKWLWESRDGRMGVLLTLLVAYLPTARRYATLGAQRNFEELRPLLAWDGRERGVRPRDFDARALWADRIAGIVGMGIVPLTALIIDRDPAIYFSHGYWHAEQAWMWGVGIVVCWNLGRFIYETLDDARCFSALAGRLREISLLDLAPLAPFARQGLGSALPCLVLISIYSINALDRSFIWAVALTGGLALAAATTTLLLPVRGIRRRIRAAKRAELRRLTGAIQGDTAELTGTAIAGRAGTLSLADLLAYRSFVESVREWPFDAPTRLRFALYLAIPVGSWLGGAFVERLLGVVLD